ncbi:hypothetical protein H1P_5270003 [Hyella patelloides LEGE 07179]|uniref:Uncharacterized protein n=1 Tax=Hyella patelloides LEGE 07179 TaxID=945734 RepID=A0A563W050_9CYAN|nr:hypothetical protein H1P_5270003 [Hyella patelloides LEGE 07179]
MVIILLNIKRASKVDFTNLQKPSLNASWLMNVNDNLQRKA